MGVARAELRIRDIPAGMAGGRRVEVTWREGRSRRAAVAEFDAPLGEAGERVRWYLEEYPEFPADPAPAIAREVEAELTRAGADLFRAVFSGPDAAGSGSWRGTGWAGCGWRWRWTPTPGRGRAWRGSCCGIRGGIRWWR